LILEFQGPVPDDKTKVTIEEIKMTNERSSMKVVVIGGTGLIGSKE